jgi:hypothetical protein
MKKSSPPDNSEPKTEAIRETGQTLRDIVAQLSGHPIFLFGIASMILAIIGFTLTSFAPDIALLSWFPYALLIFGLILVFVAVVFEQSNHAENTPDFYTSKLSYVEPAKVSVCDPHSVAPMPSQILKMPKGGISIWVYVNPFDQGIRHLVNNRYIISHDTNSGREKLVEGEGRYINVFSLARGPKYFHPPRNPDWKLWLTNAEGESWSASYIDSRDLSVGWHHFLIRWNHGKPLIELLIDGATVIHRSDYSKFWPTELSSNLLIGNWANRWDGHSVETHLWRAQPIYDFPDERWIMGELKNVPPITF